MKLKTKAGKQNLRQQAKLEKAMSLTNSGGKERTLVCPQRRFVNILFSN